jgi:catechol 2,3-dioxygenase-like lactoylglutathione lyase family enzyme
LIKNLHHAAICVSDLERSLEFYRDLLGLTVTMDFEVRGPEWDRLFQSENFHARIIYFDEGIEMTYVYSRDDKKPVDARMGDFGYQLLVFEVSDVDGIYERLKDKGVNFLSPPLVPTIDVPTEGSAKLTHILGPDGERISLLQFLS